ncbi:MAG TPA: MFS transporter [Porticoccaceae bacterium]|nr:MFS transporter [Porticoccaceae bacterium]
MGSRTASGALPYWRLSGFYFFYFALLGGLFPYWSLYLDDRGLSAEQIGAVLAIPLVTKVFAPNLWSWLADASGWRLGIIRLGAILATMCFAGIFLVDDLPGLVLVMVGYSFFWNAVLPQHEVITLGFLGARPERYSAIRLWGSVGFIAAVGAAGYAFETRGIALFPVVGFSLLVAILLSSLLIPRPVAVPAARHREPMLAVVRQPVVLAFLGAGALLQAAHGAYYSFFSLHLQNLGYGRTAIGLLWSVGVVAEVLIFAVMHRVLLRYGVRTLLLTSLALAALRWWLIGHYSASLVVLVCAQTLHAFTFGTYHAAGVETVRRLFANAGQAGGQALYGAVSFGLGGALGSWLAGQLWRFGAPLVFEVAALLCLLALALSWYGFRDPRLRD